MTIVAGNGRFFMDIYIGVQVIRLSATITPVFQSNQIKSNDILLVTYTWLADVNASVAKFLCFYF